MVDVQSIVSGFLTGKQSPDPTYEGRKAASNRMRLHAEGYGIEEMLAAYRPNLDAKQRSGQLANARLITQTHFSRLVNTFSKVLTAQDYQLIWSDETGNALSQQLKEYREYITEGYPGGSLDEWIMQQGLPAKLIEAGGAYAIVPTEAGPVVKAFRAEEVVYHLPGKLCIIAQGEYQKQSYLVYTPEQTILYALDTKAQGKRSFTQELLFETMGNVAGFRWMFAQPIRGRVVDISKPNIQASLASGVLPYWDDAFVANFDRAQSVRDHAYPMAWAYVQSECSTCGGSGKVQAKGLVTSANRGSDCSSCGGIGVVQKLSPYGMLTIRPPRSNESDNVPTPPMGYVQRDIAPLEFLSKHIREQIYQGYSALGFDFMGQEQLNQSGVAKDYDREPVRATLRAFAESFIGGNLKWIDASLVLAMHYTNGMAYDAAAIQDAVRYVTPTRVIPNEFDVLTISTSQGMLKAAREAGADAFTLSNLEQQFAIRAVGDDIDLRNIIQLRGILDPMAGRTVDEKLALKDSMAISEMDYVVSLNIERLITRARRNNRDFDSLRVDMQEGIIYKLAEALRKPVTVSQTDAPIGIAPDIEQVDIALPVQDAPSVIELQSKAELRGSVGGVTSLIQLVTSVNEGVVARDSALGILDTIYGISGAEADKILGPEKQPIPEPTA